MKRLLDIFILTVTVFSSLSICAEETDDVLLLSDFSVSQGETKVLQVLMNNVDPICAFQFTLMLPDGVSLPKDSDGNFMISLDRTSDTSPAVNFLDNVYYVAYFSPSNTPFRGNSGAICNLTLHVDENIEIGKLQIDISNIELAEPNVTKHNPGDISAILSVTPKQRAEKVVPQSGDYQIQAIPGNIISGNADNRSIEVPIFFANKGYVSDIQFTIDYPAGLDTRKLTTDKKPYEKLTVDKSRLDTGNGATVEVSAVQGASVRFVNNDIDLVLPNGSGQLLTLPISIDDNVSAGAYTVKFTDIKVTETDDLGNELETHTLPDFYFTIFVGEMTDKNPILYGDYSSPEAKKLLNAVVANVNSVDLTSAVVTEKPEMNNPNALVYVSIDCSDDDNVVVNNECRNLVIDDNYEFAAPICFYAADAIYSRDMKNTWGTICLPYEIESNEFVTYYKIVSINSNELVMEELDVLPAGTPAIVRNNSKDKIELTANNVLVNGDAGELTEAVKMCGSFSKILIEDSNAYYIKNNKFWKCNENFYCAAFRAFFKVPGVATVSSFSIVTEETASFELPSESYSEIEAIYDINGCRKNEIGEGTNIIRLSNGEVKKVIIK